MFLLTLVYFSDIKIKNIQSTLVLCNICTLVLRTKLQANFFMDFILWTDSLIQILVKQMSTSSSAVIPDYSLSAGINFSDCNRNIVLVYTAHHYRCLYLVGLFIRMKSFVFDQWNPINICILLLMESLLISVFSAFLDLMLFIFVNCCVYL